MSLEQELNQARAELVSAGFQPARHAGVVKLVRRFIWPFIRPFNFHLQDKIVALQGDMANAKHDISTKLREDITRLVSEQVALRSDVAALKNRYSAMTRLSEQIAELSQRIDSGPSREQQALLRSDVDALKNRFNEAQKGARHLAVTNTKDGLFIGKPGEIISDHIFSGGAWDSHIVTLAQEVANGKQGIAVDVGAHFGAVTLALSGLFKEVLSFEPNDFNYRVLRGNVAVNCLKNVRLFNHGLYSKEATLSLGEQSKQEIAISTNASGDFDGHAANNLGAYLFSEGGDRSFAHSARTLDSFRLADVSFIKIDVQGADGEVLMGSMETIKRCRPVVVFEWEEHLSRHFSVSFETLQKLFGELDYELSPLKAHNEKQIDYVAQPRNR